MTRKFQWGLRPEIQDAFAVLELKTYDEVLAKIIIVESRLRGLSSGVGSSRPLVPLKRHVSGYSLQDKRPRMVTEVSPRSPSTLGKAPTCLTSGKNHGNQPCHCVTRSCFKCGSQQHLICNYPLMNSQKLKDGVMSVHTNYSRCRSKPKHDSKYVSCLKEPK